MNLNGWRNLIDPLAPHHQNAFNPSFLTLWLSIACLYFIFWGGLSLKRTLDSPKRGSYSIKSSSAAQFRRVALVILHSTTVVYLAIAYASTVNYSLVAYTLLALLLVTIVIPLHVVEPVHSPLRSDCLLIIWPSMALFHALFFFQDRFTRYPILMFGPGSDTVYIEGLLSVSAMVLFYCEAFDWKPGHEMIAYLSRENKLDEMNLPTIIARLTYTWMNDLILKSHFNKTVVAADLPLIPEPVLANALSRKLKGYLDLPRTTSLIWPLFMTFGKLAFYAFVFDLLYALLGYVQPQLLRKIIIFFGLQKESDPQPVIAGLLIAFSMFFVTIIQTALYNQYFLNNLQLFLGCRLALNTLVYSKTLNLSPKAHSTTASGDIINLVSVDIGRLELIPDQLLEVIVAPVTIVVCIASLWPLLGSKATMAGVLVMVAFIPLNGIIVRKVKRLRKTQMKHKDKRTRLMSQMLASIRSIKLYAWEKPILARLSYQRNDLELKNLRWIKTLGQIGSCVWGSVPFLVSFVCFSVLTLTQSTPLTSDIVFPALLLFGLLSNPLTSLPSALTSLADASVLLNRLYSFLRLEELDHTKIERQPSSANNEIAALLENVSFSFPAKTSSEDPTPVKRAVTDLSLTVKKRLLVCLVGRVGSGKTSLFDGLLGKLDFCVSSESRAILYGQVAYCSQLPWIMNATVRQNILFGFRYDPEFYQRTVAACQLTPDMEMLPNGDETMVGERGVTLSGGQKARLALARAVYARADIYLLDDVLSAVDAHVGKRITSQVLGPNGILALKTVIMCTNSLNILNQADSIVLMQDGRIVESSSMLEATAAKHPGIHDLITNFMREKTSLPLLPLLLLPLPSPALLSEDLQADNSAKDADSISGQSTASEAALVLRRASVATFDYDPLQDMETKSSERSQKGKVKWLVYTKYARACSLSGVAIWFVSLVITSILVVAGNYWLKHWTEQNSSAGGNADAKYYIGVYFWLGIGAIISNVLRGLLLMLWLAFNASRSIHDDMACHIIAAPMWFFDSTPMGSILNRFSSDVNKIDESIPAVFSVFFTVTFKTLFKFLVIVWAIPWYLLVLSLLLVVYVYYEMWFVAALRELKRLVSLSRLPINAHLGESINGVDTIRAFDQTTRFERINEANVNFNVKCVYMLRSMGRWINFRLQWLGSLGVLGACLLCIYTLATPTPMTASMAGFIMVYSLEVTASLRTMVRFSAQVETNAVAVERCMEYLTLPGEELVDQKALAPPVQWPQSGEIVFEKYLARYKPDSELVLRDISFKVGSHEKIGVVGRTGAGKSSVALAMFRMIISSGGEIDVDNINTAAVSLYDLRSRLAIIPQDSQLLEGTVRLNLDPFLRYTDDEIWRALELSHLKDHVTGLESEDGNPLNSTVNDGGSNFLSGQRQLMSMARVLLKMESCRILILDEATALVDVQTDRLIQSTIRKEFAHKTIITIAHRLETVLDSDKVCVLDKGRVVEFDSPENLLANKNSLYYSLCHA